MILHSQKIGEGAPLVILHGFLGMGDNWKTLGRQFAAEGFQVHLVDQRNHGRSFHHKEFSYKSMAEDLLEYLDHHGIEKAVLLGHSMGGKTAMEFATTHPSRVARLIVADIAPKSYPPHHHDILKALGMLNFDELTSRSEADEVLSEYISEVGIRQFLLKNLYWVEKGKLGLRANLKVVTEHYNEIGKALDQDSVFPEATLFIGGENSGYIEDGDEVLIHKHFPKARLETVSGAGHWLHAENPSEFFMKVMRFIKS